MTSKQTDTQLATLRLREQGHTAIVFKGTTSLKDMTTNVWLAQQKLTYPAEYGSPDQPIKMHAGFIRAYLSVRKVIHALVKGDKATKYTITGHSLGGALAILCAVDLQYNFSDRISVEAYTFGAPRVGNLPFAKSYARRVPNTFRVVKGKDAVASVPKQWQDYHHVGEIIRLRGVSRRCLFGSWRDHIIDGYIDELIQAAS